MDKKQAAAKAAIGHNEGLEVVFVTSDNKPFKKLNDAQNHEKTLKGSNKPVKFSRVEGTKEVQEEKEGEDCTGCTETPKSILAKDKIAAIQKAETIEAVDQILGDDERATVVAAANKRKEELSAGTMSSEENPEGGSEKGGEAVTAEDTTA